MEMILKEITPRPLYLCNSNILSILIYMQNVIRFRKLFSKIRSRNQNDSDGHTDGQRENSIPPTNTVCGGEEGVGDGVV